MASSLQVIAHGAPLPLNLDGIDTVKDLRTCVAGFLECPMVKLLLLDDCTILEDNMGLSSVKSDSLVTAVVMATYININIELLVTHALVTLKTMLDKTELATAKLFLRMIYDHSVSSRDAVRSFPCQGFIRDAFKDLGDHLAFPIRGGEDQIRKAYYEEHESVVSNLPFLIYQSDHHEYVLARVETELL